MIDIEGENPRLRIALVELYGVGGTADYTDCLARALSARRLDVTVITSTLFEPLDGESSANVVKVFRYRSTQLKPVKAMLLTAALRRTRALLAALRPDVVHAQGTVLPAIERHFYGDLDFAARVCTVHDVTAHERRPMLGSFRRFYADFDALVCHSRASMLRLHGQLPQTPVTTIPHPRYTPLAASPCERETAREQLDISPLAPVALLFGFLRPYKGLDVFLSALAIAAARDPRVLGVVAGRPLYDIGPSRRRAERQHLPVRWDLRYVPRDEMGRYFAAADTVVLPYLDTSDSGMLELAAAFGRPVVVSATGGMQEAFERYRYGEMVPPNDPEQLAAAMFRKHDAREGQARSGGATWSAAAEQTEALYRSLIARPAVAVPA